MILVYTVYNVYFLLFCASYTHIWGYRVLFVLHSKQPNMLWKNTTFFMKKRSLPFLTLRTATCVHCTSQLWDARLGFRASFAYQEARTQDPEVLPFIPQLPCCELSSTLPHIHVPERVCVMIRIMLPYSSGSSKAQSMFTRCFWVSI